MIKGIEITVSCHQVIPTQQYGNIQPKISLKYNVESEDEAKEYIEKLSNIVRVWSSNEYKLLTGRKPDKQVEPVVEVKPLTEQYQSFKPSY